MTGTDSPFAKDILLGLTQKPKHLFSKYFYDDTGDKIFQDIMKMDEYYLTRSEYEIFSQQKEQILNQLLSTNEQFQLVEFGAGDGLKTKILLEYLLRRGADFEYIPIDISESVLRELQEDLNNKWPELNCKPIADTYFNALAQLPSDKKKMVLFLGSNIGNFRFEEAKTFLGELNSNLNEGDLFLMGVDLKKSPQLILNAYSDKQGITKSFNLNLLRRINRELNADFQLNEFDHYASYDPISGDTKSFLISKKKQDVNLEKLNKVIHFNYAEPVFMEISKKYDEDELGKLAKATNFNAVKNFYDCKHYFTNVLWEKKQ